MRTLALTHNRRKRRGIRPGEIENGLQFKLPARFAAKGINCAQITLESSDTYKGVCAQFSEKFHDVKIIQLFQNIE